MARVQINIRFFYDDVIYADALGYLPRQEAMKIPELKVEENFRRDLERKTVAPKQPSGKKEDQNDDEMIDENDEENIADMDNEEAENIDQEIEEIDEEQVEQELEIQPSDNLQYDDQDDEQDIDDDLSELSRSISPMMNYTKFKTKRQKGQLDKFIQLPNKRPRKDAKKFDEATQLIRKQEKERKRRQYIKKLTEEQQRQTFNKILNETGRKFRQREEKQLKEEQEKDRKLFHSLGNIPKIIKKDLGKNGTVIILHNTELFQPSTLCQPNVNMTENCGICSSAVGKYKSKSGVRFCSVACYQSMTQK